MSTLIDSSRSPGINLSFSTRRRLRGHKFSWIGESERLLLSPVTQHFLLKEDIRNPIMYFSQEACHPRSKARKLLCQGGGMLIQ